MQKIPSLLVRAWLETTLDIHPGWLSGFKELFAFANNMQIPVSICIWWDQAIASFDQQSLPRALNVVINTYKLALFLTASGDKAFPVKIHSGLFKTLYTEIYCLYEVDGCL